MLNDRIIPEIMEAYDTIIKKLKELEAVKMPTEEQKMELEVLRYQKKILKDALEPVLDKITTNKNKNQ